MEQMISILIIGYIAIGLFVALCVATVMSSQKRDLLSILMMAVSMIILWLPISIGAMKDMLAGKHE